MFSPAHQRSLSQCRSRGKTLAFADTIDNEFVTRSAGSDHI